MLSCLHTCRTVNKPAAQMNIAASLRGAWRVTGAAAVDQPKDSISEGATSTLLGSDTGQYAPDCTSDVHPYSSGSRSGGSCCNAAFQMQA